MHGVGEAGGAELMRPEVPRAKLLERIASLPPCLIGMEACSCAHRWARAFAAFGHSVRLMAPKFVHRARQGYVEQRTVLINRIRGLVSELGIVQPLKAVTVRREADKHLEDLPGGATPWWAMH